MKIQLSNQKIIPDALVVWYEAGPEVDIVMDIKKLTFKPGSITELFTFHVLDHLFEKEVVPTLLNWKSCLAKDAFLYVLVDDFEYLTRAYVGGDINMKIFNQNFSHPTQFSRESLIDYLLAVGFTDSEERMQVWFELPFYKKPPHELVISAKNNV